MTIKYINNRELLAEIQRSKATYCHFVATDYSKYDVIITSLDVLTPEFLESTIAHKAHKASTKAMPVDPKSIDPESIVFRLMTDSHLPPETDEKRRRKSNTTGEWVAKPNFPPFKHYILKNGETLEVGRSHWKEGLSNGRFAIEGGITRRLAEMFMLLTEQYSHRGNWRGYTYVDEMRNHALMHLCQVGLQFDESRSDNPFAFYTQIIKHCFTRILNLEKRGQTIRDDLLIMAGVNPSYTRQVDNEMDQREEEPATVTTMKNGKRTVTLAMSDLHVVGSGNRSDPESILIKKEAKKRGRKPKVKV